MLEEIKIITKDGINIFSAKLGINPMNIEQSQTDVLFAGLISAILNVSAEVQQAEIKEMEYETSRIVFIPTNELVFMGFVDKKVPSSEIEELLLNIIDKWLKIFEDKEYTRVTDEMREQIKELIVEAIQENFWWTDPELNMENGYRFVRDTLTNPGGSYFVQFLPRQYLIFSTLMVLIPILLSFIVGTLFTGFSSNPIIASSLTLSDRLRSLRATTLSIAMLWLIPPLVLELLYRDQFDYIRYIMISGIFAVALTGTILTTSYIWVKYIILPLGNINITQFLSINEVYNFILVVFLFFGPFNLFFFSFVIFTAYSGSFVVKIPTRKYYFSYLLSLLIVISISEFLVGNLSDFLQIYQTQFP